MVLHYETFLLQIDYKDRYLPLSSYTLEKIKIKDNKSPLFFNPIDPRHFVLVVHLKISLGNEPAIGARQLCGELGICGYFKVILAKAGGNSDVTL